MVKRKRAYKQDATEKKIMFENRTVEYESGIALDIGHGATKSKSTSSKRTKRTQCKCGSKTHLTARSADCPFNKKNLLKAKAAASKGKEGEDFAEETV